jgi:hypothetical protein
LDIAYARIDELGTVVARLQAEIERLRTPTIGLIHTGTDVRGPYAYRDLPGGHRLTVDLQDVAYLSYPLRVQAEFSVSSTKPYYAIVVRIKDGAKRRSVSLARLIARPEAGQHVDHADQDTFNNRRYNLRNVTPQQNMTNKRPYVSPVSTEAKHYARTAADPLEEVK